MTFHPGFFGTGGVVRILELLEHPGRGGGAEAVVGDVDHGQRRGIIFRLRRVVAHQQRNVFGNAQPFAAAGQVRAFRQLTVGAENSRGCRVFVEQGRSGLEAEFGAA